MAKRTALTQDTHGSAKQLADPQPRDFPLGRQHALFRDVGDSPTASGMRFRSLGRSLNNVAHYSTQLLNLVWLCDNTLETVLSILGHHGVFRVAA